MFIILRVALVVLGGLVTASAWGAPPENGGRRDVVADQVGPASSGRMALLIGNAAYASLPPLSGPPHDLAVLAPALERLEFSVQVLRDVSQSRFREGLARFAGRVPAGATVILYFSGHGMQWAGENYLLPVDASVRTAADAPTAGVSVGDVLDRLANTGATVRLVFVDACRSPPLAQRGVPAGFTEQRTPMGFLVAFASQPGATASDEGWFSEALAGGLGLPGVDVSVSLRAIRARVAERSGGTQTPWVLDQLPPGETILLSEPFGGPTDASGAGMPRAPTTHHMPLEPPPLPADFPVPRATESEASVLRRPVYDLEDYQRRAEDLRWVWCGKAATETPELNAIFTERCRAWTLYGSRVEALDAAMTRDFRLLGQDLRRDDADRRTREMAIDAFVYRYPPREFADWRVLEARWSERWVSGPVSLRDERVPVGPLVWTGYVTSAVVEDSRGVDWKIRQLAVTSAANPPCARDVRRWQTGVVVALSSAGLIALAVPAGVAVGELSDSWSAGGWTMAAVMGAGTGGMVWSASGMNDARAEIVACAGR